MELLLLTPAEALLENYGCQHPFWTGIYSILLEVIVERKNVVSLWHREARRAHAGLGRLVEHRHSVGGAVAGRGAR